jgi:hypothetical protein
VKLAVTPKGKLNVAVPYVGGALEAQIVDIIRTGTCTQLLQFRCERERCVAVSQPTSAWEKTA